jgi:hypothetical protein
VVVGALPLLVTVDVFGGGVCPTRVVVVVRFVGVGELPGFSDVGSGPGPMVWKDTLGVYVMIVVTPGGNWRFSPCGGPSAGAGT